MHDCRLLHLHPGEALKTDIINPEIDFHAVQSEFRTKRRGKNYGLGSVICLNLVLHVVPCYAPTSKMTTV